MEEEKPQIATLDEQFCDFSRMLDSKRDGTTITLFLSDYWLRQAKVIDDRHVTTTDTGVAWLKFSKTELNYEEWYDFLSDLCHEKELNPEEVETALVTCGAPGTVDVVVPEYKKFFDTYKPKNYMINQPE